MITRNRSLAETLYRKLYLFVEDEGGAGGSGSGDGETAPGGDTGSEGSGEGTGGFEAPKDRAEFERMTKNRLDRAMKGKVDPAELGFKSKKEMEEAITAFRRSEEDKLSDQEKAIEAARKEARQEAESEIMGRANARLVKADFLAAARDRNVTAPDDLYLIAKAEGRLDDLTVNDQDAVEGMDKSWWEELLKGRDHLVSAESGSDSSPPQTPGGTSDAGTRSGGGRPGTRGKGPTVERQQDLATQYPALQRR